MNQSAAKPRRFSDSGDSSPWTTSSSSSQRSEGRKSNLCRRSSHPTPPQLSPSQSGMLGASLAPSVSSIPSTCHVPGKPPPAPMSKVTKISVHKVPRPRLGSYPYGGNTKYYDMDIIPQKDVGQNICRQGMQNGVHFDRFSEHLGLLLQLNPGQGRCPVSQHYAVTGVPGGGVPDASKDGHMAGKGTPTIEWLMHQGKPPVQPASNKRCVLLGKAKKKRGSKKSSSSCVLDKGREEACVHNHFRSQTSPVNSQVFMKDTELQPPSMDEMSIEDSASALNRRLRRWGSADTLATSYCDSISSKCSSLTDISLSSAPPQIFNNDGIQANKFSNRHDIFHLIENRNNANNKRFISDDDSTSTSGVHVDSVVASEEGTGQRCSSLLQQLMDKVDGKKNGLVGFVLQSMENEGREKDQAMTQLAGALKQQQRALEVSVQSSTSSHQ